ncbi:caspase domain-containing protein [Gloeopeniophorella convolvens]|nr:caspase domain-containing protein [Gloeopeniophorella convolvens]
MSWIHYLCGGLRRQPQYAQPVMTAPSNAPNLIPFPTSSTGHLLPPSPIPNAHGHHSRSHSHSSSHRDHRHRHHSDHRRSRSSSLVPSPVPSPAFVSSPSPVPTAQGHHYRPRTNSHSSDRHHHHHHRSHSSHGHHHSSSPSHRHSHSHSRSRSRHHSRSTTPAPPMLTSHNSEPVGPYVATPIPYPAPGYQQYVVQPGYVLAPAPATSPMPVPMPSPAPGMIPRSIPSPQYPASAGVPNTFAMSTHVQTRSLHVPHALRSHGRQPLLSQEVDAAPQHAPQHTRFEGLTHPLFRHSRCTGRRKAVCVGINYTGSSNELQGCVNDARNIYQFIMQHHRYPHENIIVLTDDNPDPRSHPTRKNLINAMRWLVEDASPDDALFFHYSGHGGRTRDLDGDEIDGWDEVIFPVDYKTAGIITDDDLHRMMVDPLPAGCRLTGVFDSCHSASILDLPFEYHSNGRPKNISPVSLAFRKQKTTPADVITFSGSKDSQTSADVVQGGVAVGAMSYALLKVLKANPRISYLDLLRGVRAILNKKYSQKPQLSSSHEIDISLKFIM